MEELLKSKTFWAGLAGIGSGIALIIGGNTQEGVQAIITGVSVIFIRDAIRTK